MLLLIVKSSLQCATDWLIDKHQQNKQTFRSISLCVFNQCKKEVAQSHHHQWQAAVYSLAWNLAGTNTNIWTIADHIQRIRGFGDNALYKSTFYLLTYLLTINWPDKWAWVKLGARNYFKILTVSKYRFAVVSVIILRWLSAPCGSGAVRIDPLHFLARCRTRRLNQA